MFDKTLCNDLEQVDAKFMLVLQVVNVSHAASPILYLRIVTDHSKAKVHQCMRWYGGGAFGPSI